MNIDNKLDKLKNIRQVDAPPFLYTRISRQMEKLTDAAVPVKGQLVFAAATAIIVLLNLAVLLTTVRQNKSYGMEQVARSMQLSTSNELYHE